MKLIVLLIYFQIILTFGKRLRNQKYNDTEQVWHLLSFYQGFMDFNLYIKICKNLYFFRKSKKLQNKHYFQAYVSSMESWQIQENV